MNGISQNQAKLVRGLQQKKMRQETGLFLVEGAKAVKETIQASWPCQTLFCTENFLDTAGIQNSLMNEMKVSICSESQLSQLGNFQSNNAAILVAVQKKAGISPENAQNFWLAVEDISDPGNLGTIIRLADWFGLNQLLCLGNCVEWYNPKVISSTMGSFLRINAVEVSSDQILTSGRPWYAADMNGQNLYGFQFPEKSILLIGNEAKGLSEKWLKKTSSILSIPSFGKAESLNAAMATGIFLNHWRFSMHKK